MAPSINEQIDVQTIPSSLSHPYQSLEFTNRQRILDIVSEQIEAGRSGLIHQPVILAWGVSGLGKSWLLRHIERLYASSSLMLKRKRIRKGTVTALVDFHNFASGPDWLSTMFSTLVTDLTSHTSQAKGEDNTELITSLNTTINAFSRGNETRDAVAEVFITYVRKLTDTFIPILLFDTVESLEESDLDTFLWLEKHLIGPIVREDKAIVILACRHELQRLRQFEVRRRIKKLPLESFGDIETESQMEAAQVREFKQVAFVVHQFTSGLPLANWYLHSRLDGLRKPGEQFDKKFVDARKKDIAALLLEIEEWLLRASPEPKTSKLLRLVSTLRRFHIRSLQLILSDLEGDSSLLQHPDSDFQDMIVAMLATNLVRWSSPHGGYILDPTVRNILNRRLLLQDPELYRDRQTSAVKLYTNWINEIPKNCGRFVIEATFHISSRSEASDLSKDLLWHEIEELLNKSLKVEFFELDGANFFLEELKNDDELRVMLPELYPKLLERAEAFHAEVKGNMLASTN